MLTQNEEFVTVLVDLFYRINKKNNNKNNETIEFQDITTYLIEHEIAFDAMASGDGGGSSNNQMNQMEYFPVEINKENLVPHHNYIEKV